MTIRLLRAATLLAAAVCSTLALAADPPSVVGRIAIAEGQVRIVGDAGDEAAGAQVNWPVTSHNVVSTARGARTEIRIGSTSLRLDGDTSVEVTELDDDSLRLRLNYGSINVRVRNGDVVRGFELETPNGVVRLQEAGAVRVDSDRVPGVTSVTALIGTAMVNDRGGQLIVRQGKRLDVGDDIRTGAARLDAFDDWAGQRDQYEERSVSARYVTTEMTGYEDLDRHGVWRDDAEYGALWMPTTVASDWAPYRDGSWTWISPWGWTWVDNAPWGYAPFHYGRWVQVNQRWAWAPGRRVDRPVWAPALVGWVGGASWNLNFNSGGRRPATGWYPLSPRDAFVPNYRMSADHLQRINRDHDGRPNGGRDVRDGRGDGRGDQPRHGLTVVPQAQFGQRGTVPVRNAPRTTGPLGNLPTAAGPGAAPGAPAGVVVQRGRMDRDDWERNRPHRPEMGGAPAPATQQGGPARSPLAPNQPQRDERGPRQQPAGAPLMAPPAAQPQQRPQDQRQQEPRRPDQRDQQPNQLRQQQERQQQDQQRQQQERQQQDQQRQQQEQQSQQQDQQRQQQDQQRQQQEQRQRQQLQQDQQRQQQDQQRQQQDQQRQQQQQQQQQQQRQQQEQRDQQQRPARDDERGRGQRQAAPAAPAQPQPAAPAPVRQAAPAPAPAPVAAPAAPAPAAERNRANAERNAERKRGGDPSEVNR